MRTSEIDIAFFKSAIAKQSVVSTTSDVLTWIAARNADVSTRVERIPFSSLRGWCVDPDTGDIRHSTGRFFSVEGIRVTTNWGQVPSWDQPIVNQPEIGFLGILTQKHEGILHFLMQAKIEPGNLNRVQLSPTLQATKSNYNRVHGGAAPLFLDYFVGNKPSRVLFDQLQSEQGARFLRKRNRNIIIE